MKGTVLFVDDEPHFTSALQRALRHEPYRILTANSAARALEILASEPVDVVVSDERMPGMSGSEFLAVVRRRHPRTVRILLTGYATLDAAVKAINEGEIYRFLTKPCQAKDLSEIIRQALAISRHMDKAKERPAGSAEETDPLGVLSELERHYPGITRIKMDETGAIILDDTDLGLDRPPESNEESV
ncbi:MAG: response regulator [Desulfosoma sp.]